MQKCVGNRFWVLKNLYKGKKGDGTRQKDVEAVAIKKTDAQTNKEVTKLRRDDGTPIQITAVYEFKKCIGAILYHCSEADSDKMQHEMCPRGPESWCKYQVDIANGKNNYKKSENSSSETCEKPN